MKRAFKMKQKAFFITLKGLWIKQTKIFLGGCKSPTLKLSLKSFIGHNKLNQINGTFELIKV